MRMTYDQLDAIKDKYGVKELWSYSKYSTYLTSHYEWMLKYIRHLPENNDKQSAYSVLGGSAHDALEKFYNDELKYNQLADEFDDAFTTNIDIAGLYFDRNDTTKNDNIKTKYYNNVMAYFKSFHPIEYKTYMEQFLAIKISDDIVFQGYLDCLYKDDEGYYNIVDFKTSTKYSGKAINEHSAQLVLYAEGLRQRGVQPDKIKCCFYFLKYVDVDCEQINGKIKTRTIERYDLGNALQASVKSWMKKFKYSEDDIFKYLDKMVLTNSIECLPEEIKCKYVIKDCISYIDGIWDLYDNLKDEIIETISEIKDKVDKYNQLKDINLNEAEHLFWDDEESLKAQSYYYNNLCGYNISTIKPYKEYLDQINPLNNNLLQTNKAVDNSEEDDLEWLNLL